jgi:hypothetical protein
MGKKPAGAASPGQQPGKGAKRPAAADAADIDNLFARLPKRNARAPGGGGDSAAADAPGRARGPGSGFPAGVAPPSRPVGRPRGGEPPVRRDKPVVKSRPHYLDNGEKLVPVRCGKYERRDTLRGQRPLTPKPCDAVQHTVRRDGSRTGCRCTSRSMTSLTCKRCVPSAATSHTHHRLNAAAVRAAQDQAKQQAGPLNGGKCPFDCWCCVVRSARCMSATLCSALFSSMSIHSLFSSDAATAAAAGGAQGAGGGARQLQCV